MCLPLRSRRDEAGIAEPTARLLNQLGLLFRAKALYVEAEPLYRRALKIYEASFGPNHPQVAIGLNNLALLLDATNRLADAEPLYRRALALWRGELWAASSKRGARPQQSRRAAPSHQPLW